MPVYVFACDKCYEDKEFWLNHIITDEEKNNQICKCGNKMHQEIYTQRFYMKGKASPGDTHYGWQLDPRGYKTEDHCYAKKMRMEKREGRQKVV